LALFLFFNLIFNLQGREHMKSGCYTALVTPFTPDGSQIDRDGLKKLVSFQIDNGITGILAAGTTGESPTLAWAEHNELIRQVAEMAKGRCACIAGTGSNNTHEALLATEHAANQGVDAALIVDPYYNGPSSLEIRREYVAPIAHRFPELQIIPYVIPGRTGAKLLPEDLAILHMTYPNVGTVKEATGDLENMRRIRVCCGPEYVILSGDDGLTMEMMTDSEISAAGVISVASNVAPRAMTQLVSLLNQGDRDEAEKLWVAVSPLFDLVTVKTQETTAYGEVLCRARNPLAIKTLMMVLGMPSGPCRRPLGKMSRKGLDVVLDTARKVWNNNPEILLPVATYFGIDVGERLENPEYSARLYYPDY
jgi:4-hydroxy-tetrahydrodipicolinate synthase